MTEGVLNEATFFSYDQHGTCGRDCATDRIAGRRDR